MKRTMPAIFRWTCYATLQLAAEVQKAEQSWCCQVTEAVTIIRANFGQADPNVELTEINVRENLFMPEITGLKYITIEGLQFAHAAANWAPPVLELQTGAVGTRMGKHWIIENCTITNARCVGIILGHAPGVDYRDIDAFGDHVIRNNVIRRCGQAGIAGQKGATRCIIAGNLIEDTNYRREFGGWETAAIKFHNSIDTVISGNLIRGVFRQDQGAFGSGKQTAGSRHSDFILPGNTSTSNPSLIEKEPCCAMQNSRIDGVVFSLAGMLDVCCLVGGEVARRARREYGATARSACADLGLGR